MDKKMTKKEMLAWHEGHSRRPVEYDTCEETEAWNKGFLQAEAERRATADEEWKRREPERRAAEVRGYVIWTLAIVALVLLGVVCGTDAGPISGDYDGCGADKFC